MDTDRLRALLGFYEEDPTDSFTRFAVALEYAKNGDLAHASDWLEALRRDDPDYVGTYYHLAALYREQGRTDAAEKIYRAGIAVADRTRDLHAAAELRSALMDLQDGLE